MLFIKNYPIMSASYIIGGLQVQFLKNNLEVGIFADFIESAKAFIDTILDTITFDSVLDIDTCRNVFELYGLLGKAYIAYFESANNKKYPPLNELVCIMHKLHMENCRNACYRVYYNDVYDNTFNSYFCSYGLDEEWYDFEYDVADHCAFSDMMYAIYRMDAFDHSGIYLAEEYNWEN